MNSPELFLKSAAEKIHKNHANELGEILVVLPGNRASRFFINHLKSLISDVSWMPDCLSMTGFVNRVSHLKSTGSIDQLFTLFNAYRKMSEQTSLEDFLKWGVTVLNDYKEIENYLLDDQKVYSDLTSIKEIEEWSFNEEELSKSQTDFMAFWNMLGKLKTEFDVKLKNQEKGYYGLQIRESISRIESNDLNLPWKKVYVLGMNALSNSETELFRLLSLENKAEIISDSDSYYHEKLVHEAGLFMRKQEKDFKLSHVLTDGFKDQKNINYLKCNTTIGMAKTAAEFVDEKSENTVLVLGDENLLVPLISSLPEEVNQVNITMGFSLVDGQVWAGISKLLKAIYNNDKKGFYHLNEISQAVSDPFLNVLISNKVEVWVLDKEQKSQLKITDKDLLELKELDDVLYSLLNSSDSSELLNSLLKFLEKSNLAYRAHTEFVKEQVNIAYTFVAKLKNQVSEIPELNRIRNLSFLVDKLANIEKIPFLGEPHGGIQIMGLLETRALDFDHVIYCGATDALLPAVKSDNSFIPFELKSHYGLPTNNEKEAVFAYSFYRLIQRAKSVDFIYTETEEGINVNEKSRYLVQMESELVRYNGQKINRKITKSHSSVNAISPTRIEVKEEHKEKIKKLLSNGISASAINTFISCPADFYYKYIVGLREPDKNEDVVHPSVTGGILHNVLEELYTPYVKQVLSESAVKNIIKKSEESLQKEIEKQKLTDEFKSGQNILELELMKRKLSDFLKWELSQVKKHEKANQVITIESLEEKYLAEIPELELEDGTSVKLRGIIDRIDRVGNKLRVVDYKSGTVKQADLGLATLADFSNDKKGKALQLLLYGILVGTNNPQALEHGFTCGNISLKSVSSGLLNVNVGGRKNPDLLITSEVVSEIIPHFKEFFNSMVDGLDYFEHDSEAMYCDFCVE